MKHTIIISTLFTALFSYSSVMALENRPYSEHGERRGPPQVAIDACASSSSGDACTFSGRRNDTVTGTCEAVHGDQLICVPEGGPPGMRHGDDRR